MKRLIVFGLSIFVFTFLFGADYASAQRKLIERGTYSERTWSARSAVYDKKRTVETVHEGYKDGSIDSTVTILYQYLSDDHYRSLRTSVKSDGGKIESEEIRIGGFLYTRETPVGWSVSELSKQGYGTGTGTGSGGAMRLPAVQYSVEPVFLGSWPAELFEEIKITDDDNAIQFTETRYWIGSDGSLLQEEIVEGSLFPRVVKKRTVRTYEYDPNIKIEAPIP